MAIKSKYSHLLNELDQMAGSVTHAYRKHTLRQAEALITNLEEQVATLQAKHDALLSALKRVEVWSEHTLELAVDKGSNGVRDFYREIARTTINTVEAAL